MGKARIAGRRPLDLRSGTSHPNLTADGHLLAKEYGRYSFTLSTAASTSITARGVYGVSATSTTNGAQALNTITAPASGRELRIFVNSAAASSFTFKFNALTGNFGTLPGTTELTQIQLAGVVGNGVHLLGLSTSRWALLEHTNATLSSATG